MKLPARRQRLSTIDDLKQSKGVFWLSKNHTGHPVFLIATGLDSEAVRGFMDNTEIHKVMVEAIK
jgi:alkaline phosphatase